MQDLERGAASFGLNLDPSVLGAFDRLLQLLREAGTVQNLTAIRDPADIVQRHFLESIAVGQALAQQGLLHEESRILDLGSGAGFPGLPFKLVWPAINLTLVEATAKKARFIQAAVDALGLRQTRVLTGRAEILAHERALRETHDVVIARAVAALPALIEMALPFLRVGGTLAAVKGSHAAEELEASAAALRLCGGAAAGIQSVMPLDTLNTARLVLIEKKRPTPARYPRGPGQPAKHPLHD